MEEEEQDSESTTVKDTDADSFLDAWDTWDSSDHLLTTSIQSEEPPESPSSSSNADLSDRQIIPPKTSNQSSSPSHSFSNITDRFINDSDPNVSTTLNQESKSKLSSTSVCKPGDSSITTVNNNDVVRINDGSVTSDSPDSVSIFIFALARFVTKLIGYQLNLLVSIISLPGWLIYGSYVFVTDPFRIIRFAKCYLVEKISRICGVCYGCVKWSVIRKHDATWKLCLHIVWGLLWSVYVGFVLISLLVFACVVSGIILRSIVDEPIRITEELNFDYTKDTPTAFVPLVSCPEGDFLEYGEPVFPGCSAESRVIPFGHRVQAIVSLSLPESDYNRNLGVFQRMQDGSVENADKGMFGGCCSLVTRKQYSCKYPPKFDIILVRVDFLSFDGKRIASTRQLCMLHFKSQPIRLVSTFLNLAPLITGYSSESQTLNIKFKGYTETGVPTSCLRVVLEQRAEFTSGRGVPELYTASLKLESQPPFLKRILWSWKGTIYVWVSVTIFGVEFLFTLICCTPVILPWIRPRGVSSNNVAARSTRVGPK
ncbi:hypothetical protein OSB04_008365 [Centaurea solstitialis]|uniref:Seipin n=1 Tax=Centaurea solstitialis TaxID=347529 RepID=A0AA38TLM5_9ASTR|nr:hypothetical protein OSB04_008365 [Centaurea solstitialis]